MIDRFDGEYRFLSNFWPASIKYNGIRYPTVEHAYQAQKTLDEEERHKIAKLRSPFTAKQHGSIVKLRPDWYSISLGVMYDLVYLKFANYPDLKRDLLATGDQKLVEGNDWGDRFWGTVDGKGENHLGKILMRVRDALRLDLENKPATME